MPRLKPAPMGALLFIFCVFVGPFRAKADDLVVNGGFQSGVFAPGWNATNTANDGVLAVDGAGGYDGLTYDVAFGCATSGCSVSQTLGTVAGQTYEVAYFLEDDGTNMSTGKSGAGASFYAQWDGQQIVGSLYNNTTGAGMNYAEYVFTVQADGNDTLSFAGEDPNSILRLDDVSVSTLGGPPPLLSPVATAEPSGTLMLLLGLCAVAWVGRRQWLGNIA